MNDAADPKARVIRLDRRCSPALSALVGLVGVALGAWLTAGRAHKEKLWDLRRQAYGVTQMACP